MRHLFVFAFTIVTLTSYAQVNPKQRTTAWTYTQLFNGRNQQTLEASGKLVTYPGQKIDWIQNNGAFTDSYLITSANGSWTDLSKDGSVQFTITWGESTGTFTFTKLNGTTIAELSLKNPGRPDSYFKFTITSASAQ